MNKSYEDESDIALVCSSCGNQFYSIAKVKLNMNLQNKMDIIGFSAKVFCTCPKCGQIMDEKDLYMSNAVSALIRKHYMVVDCNSGIWGPGELYAPYIKILTGGPAKINPPEGWEDVTGPSVGSFQVFVPSGSYGCAEDGADPSAYSVETMFTNEEEFLNTKKAFIAQLEEWVSSLDINTTIATKKDLRGSSDVIDID